MSTPQHGCVLAVKAPWVHPPHILHNGPEVHVSQHMLVHINARRNFHQLYALFMSLEDSSLSDIEDRPAQQDKE